MSRTSVLALSFFRGKTSVPAEDPNDATFTDLFAEAEPGGEEAAPTEGEPDAEMDPREMIWSKMKTWNKEMSRVRPLRNGCVETGAWILMILPA